MNTRVYEVRAVCWSLLLYMIAVVATALHSHTDRLSTLSRTGDEKQMQFFNIMLPIFVRSISSLIPFFSLLYTQYLSTYHRHCHEMNKNSFLKWDLEWMYWNRFFLRILSRNPDGWMIMYTLNVCFVLHIFVINGEGRRRILVENILCDTILFFIPRNSQSRKEIAAK
jgi:hypothetical protein